MSALGTLYLIPTPLGPAELDTLLPPAVLAVVRRLDCFVAENAKTARAFLKAAGVERPLAQIRIDELNEHTRAEAVPALLEPLLAGHDTGLVSEAGAPGVADPGALLVRAAHANGIAVRPLVGPSSILLGLMASGLDGQRFAFHGYLPVDSAERSKRLRELEAASRRDRMTQIFIETPYRNPAFFESLLALAPQTRLCVARELATPEEWIATDTVAGWKKRPRPELGKRPAVFMLLGQ
jgi:16S rRNA (cytidine1402-2'-O)-methyltransferase